jgi:hypothetical protein
MSRQPPAKKAEKISRIDASNDRLAHWLHTVPGGRGDRRCISSTRLTAPAWEQQTPFGRPVEPEV